MQQNYRVHERITIKCILRDLTTVKPNLDMKMKFVYMQISQKYPRENIADWDAEISQFSCSPKKIEYYRIIKIAVSFTIQEPYGNILSQIIFR